MLASDVIDTVKGMLYPNIGPINLSMGSMLQVLNAIDRNVHSMVATIAPDTLIISATVSIPADVGAGVTITAAERYISFFYLRDTDGTLTKIKIRPERDRADGESPSAYIASDVLFPIDPFGQNWDKGDQTARPWFNDVNDTIFYDFIAKFVPVTALSGTLSSPDIGQAYIEAELYVRSLLRVNGVQDEQFQLAGITAQTAKQDLMMLLAKLYSIESRVGSLEGGLNESIRSRLF